MNCLKISDTEDYNKVKEWAVTKGLVEELDAFIEELKEQDLILNESHQKSQEYIDLENLSNIIK